MLRHSYLSDTHVGLLKQSAIENDGFSFGFFFIFELVFKIWESVSGIDCMEKQFSYGGISCLCIFP